MSKDETKNTNQPIDDKLQSKHNEYMHKPLGISVFTNYNDITNDNMVHDESLEKSVEKSNENGDRNKNKLHDSVCTVLFIKTLNDTVQNEPYNYCNNEKDNKKTTENRYFCGSLPKVIDISHIYDNCVTMTVVNKYKNWNNFKKKKRRKKWKYKYIPQSNQFHINGCIEIECILDGKNISDNKPQIHDNQLKHKQEFYFEGQSVSSDINSISSCIVLLTSTNIDCDSDNKCCFNIGSNDCDGIFKCGNNSTIINNINSSSTRLVAETNHSTSKSSKLLLIFEDSVRMIQNSAANQEHARPHILSLTRISNENHQSRKNLKNSICVDHNTNNDDSFRLYSIFDDLSHGEQSHLHNQLAHNNLYVSSMNKNGNSNNHSKNSTGTKRLWVKCLRLTDNLARIDNIYIMKCTFQMGVNCDIHDVKEYSDVERTKIKKSILKRSDDGSCISIDIVKFKENLVYNNSDWLDYFSCNGIEYQVKTMDGNLIDTCNCNVSSYLINITMKTANISCPGDDEASTENHFIEIAILVSVINCTKAVFKYFDNDKIIIDVDRVNIVNRCDRMDKLLIVTILISCTMYVAKSSELVNITNNDNIRSNSMIIHIDITNVNNNFFYVKKLLLYNATEYSQNTVDGALTSRFVISIAFDSIDKLSNVHVEVITIEHCDRRRITLKPLDLVSNLCNIYGISCQQNIFISLNLMNKSCALSASHEIQHKINNFENKTIYTLLKMSKILEFSDDTINAIKSNLNLVSIRNIVFEYLQASDGLTLSNGHARLVHTLQLSHSTIDTSISYDAFLVVVHILIGFWIEMYFDKLRLFNFVLIIVKNLCELFIEELLVIIRKYRHLVVVKAALIMSVFHNLIKSDDGIPERKTLDCCSYVLSKNWNFNKMTIKIKVQHNSSNVYNDSTSQEATSTGTTDVANEFFDNLISYTTIDLSHLSTVHATSVPCMRIADTTSELDSSSAIVTYFLIFKVTASMIDVECNLCYCSGAALSLIIEIGVTYSAEKQIKNSSNLLYNIVNLGISMDIIISKTATIIAYFGIIYESLHYHGLFMIIRNIASKIVNIVVLEQLIVNLILIDMKDEIRNISDFEVNLVKLICLAYNLNALSIVITGLSSIKITLFVCMIHSIPMLCDLFLLYASNIISASVIHGLKVVNVVLVGIIIQLLYYVMYCQLKIHEFDFTDICTYGHVFKHFMYGKMLIHTVNDCYLVLLGKKTCTITTRQILFMLLSVIPVLLCNAMFNDNKIFTTLEIEHVTINKVNNSLFGIFHSVNLMNISLCQIAAVSMAVQHYVIAIVFIELFYIVTQALYCVGNAVEHVEECGILAHAIDFTLIHLFLLLLVVVCVLFLNFIIKILYYVVCDQTQFQVCTANIILIGYYCNNYWYVTDDPLLQCVFNFNGYLIAVIFLVILLPLNTIQTILNMLFFTIDNSSNVTVFDQRLFIGIGDAQLSINFIHLLQYFIALLASVMIAFKNMQNLYQLLVITNARRKILSHTQETNNCYYLRINSILMSVTEFGKLRHNLFNVNSVSFCMINEQEISEIDKLKKIYNASVQVDEFVKITWIGINKNNNLSNNMILLFAESVVHKIFEQFTCFVCVMMAMISIISSISDFGGRIHGPGEIKIDELRWLQLHEAVLVSVQNIIILKFGELLMVYVMILFRSISIGVGILIATLFRDVARDTVRKMCMTKFVNNMYGLYNSGILV